MDQLEELCDLGQMNPTQSLLPDTFSCEMGIRAPPSQAPSSCGCRNKTRRADVHVALRSELLLHRRDHLQCSHNSGHGELPLPWPTELPAASWCSTCPVSFRFVLVRHPCSSLATCSYHGDSDSRQRLWLILIQPCPPMSVLVFLARALPSFLAPEVVEEKEH